MPLMFDGIGTSLPLIRSGKLKAIAVSATPHAGAAEVPTFTELGYATKLEALAWMGLWCPPDVPQSVAPARSHAARLPSVRERLGFDLGAPRSVAEIEAGLKADYERVGAMLQSIGFKAE